ncbi:hypothetical protein KTE60_10030 [Burkholderia multivorans]|uniref:hypothetical protein n=1 Tax=Burkholderia multivorans TaxID=87883 RepID=UPI001C21C478|nr:hypothetical protein [Burkholderia multivorans]MBU9629623.1 hypothetical protein [Burkholderia multivorans]
MLDAELAQAELTPDECEIAVGLNRNGYAVIDFPDTELDVRITRIHEHLTKQQR